MRRHSGLNGEQIDNIEWIIKEITNIVEDISGVEDLNPQVDFSEQGIDSMALLDMLTILENRFHVVLNEGLVGEFTSITRVAHIVQQALRKLDGSQKSLESDR